MSREPLVSIVIPTYQRPEYFAMALESVLAQTYKNLDIFITDNSHNEDTKNIIQKYLGDERIHYEHHPDFDAVGNWQRAFDYNNPQAEYVNFLMDDDVFMPDKIKIMLDLYQSNSGVSLVTSYRALIDSEGNLLPEPEWNKRLSDKPIRCSGKDMGKRILMDIINYIGEPTTVLVCKKYLKDNYYGWNKLPTDRRISDFPCWLHLLTQGDMIYWPEPLSFMRIHDGQQQRSVECQYAGFLCWAEEIMYAWKQRKFLDTVEEYRQALANYIGTAVVFLAKYYNFNQQNVDGMKLERMMHNVLDEMMRVRS